MSYSNVLRANASMFSKAKVMLEGDAQARRYRRGLSKAAATKEASDQLISDKIQQIVNEKREIAQELTRDYNRDTDVSNQKIMTIHNMKKLGTSLNREISRNDLKLARLRNDILTLRRQIETSENEHSKKSFIVFFLKNIFIFLLAVILVMLLVKNGNIPQEMAVKINIGLAVILSIVSAVRIWLNRYSHSSVMSKQNFVLDRPTPKPKE
tara:strand:+ start:1317 stop:1946 length:630 start_codon:yes stop_codon:yes gene_type:complete